MEAKFAYEMKCLCLARCGGTPDSRSGLFTHYPRLTMVAVTIDVVFSASPVDYETWHAVCCKGRGGIS